MSAGVGTPHSVKRVDYLVRKPGKRILIPKTGTKRFSSPKRSARFLVPTIPCLIGFVEFFFRIYRTIILPVVLYGCETWSLTSRKERRLRVFENKVLRRIFGPRRDEVTGYWRRLHNEEVNDLYSSPNIVRVIK